MSSLVVITAILVIFVYSLLAYDLEKDLKKAQNIKMELINRINTNIVKPDPLVMAFNKRKYEIAYNNKVEQIKRKINEMKYTTAHKELSEMIASMIIVPMAESEVENDRKMGKLDDLYSEK